MENCVIFSCLRRPEAVKRLYCAILRAEGREFVGHIGGDCVGGECASTGGDELFVTEACEYNRTFLALKPDVAAVLGIAFDHPDCYRDLAELKAAFRDFASNIERGGALVVRTSEKGLCPKGVRCVTFGYSECDYRAEDVCYSDGLYSFVVAERGVRKAVCRLKVRGKFNVVNALAAIATVLSNADATSAKNAFRSMQSAPASRAAASSGSSLGTAAV